MDKIAKYSCVETLKKKGSPVVIVSLVEEAEAVLNACKEAGIKVKYKITDKENFLVDYIAGSESIINDIQNNIDISYIDV